MKQLKFPLILGMFVLINFLSNYGMQFTVDRNIWQMENLANEDLYKKLVPLITNIGKILVNDDKISSSCGIEKDALIKCLKTYENTLKLKPIQENNFNLRSNFSNHLACSTNHSNHMVCSNKKPIIFLLNLEQNSPDEQKFALYFLSLDKDKNYSSGVVPMLNKFRNFTWANVSCEKMIMLKSKDIRNKDNGMKEEALEKYTKDKIKDEISMEMENKNEEIEAEVQKELKDKIECLKNSGELENKINEESTEKK